MSSYARDKNLSARRKKYIYQLKSFIGKMYKLQKSLLNSISSGEKVSSKYVIRLHKYNNRFKKLAGLLKIRNTEKITILKNWRIDLDELYSNMESLNLYFDARGYNDYLRDYDNRVMLANRSFFDPRKMSSPVSSSKNISWSNNNKVRKYYKEYDDEGNEKEDPRLLNLSKRAKKNNNTTKKSNLKKKGGRKSRRRKRRTLRRKRTRKRRR